MRPRPSLPIESDRPVALGPLDRVSALLDLIGPFPLDLAAIATLTGLTVPQLEAHLRLGHLLVEPETNRVVSIK